MAQLIQVRTNTRFNLNYEEKKLEPEIELILVIGQPKYIIDRKKKEVVKDIGASEVRVNVSPEMLTDIIGQLTALQVPVSGFQNMAEAFNTIIKNSPEPKNDK